MCITELRLTCCPNEFTLRENKFKLLLLIDGGPGGCREKRKHPAHVALKIRNEVSLRLVVSVPFALGRVWRRCTGCRSAAAADAPLCPCPTLWQLYTWSVEENTRWKHEGKHHMAFRSSTAGYVFEPPPKYNADALWLWVSVNQTVLIAKVRIVIPINCKHLALCAQFNKSMNGWKKETQRAAIHLKWVSSWCNE